MLSMEKSELTCLRLQQGGTWMQDDVHAGLPSFVGLG